MYRALVLSLTVGAIATLATALKTASATNTPSTATSAIVIYEQANFQGRALTLTSATPDLKPLGFDNKVASLTINGGGEWVLCENRNYTGRCIRVRDKAGDLAALQLWGRVSSLYPVPKAPAAEPATP